MYDIVKGCENYGSAGYKHFVSKVNVEGMWMEFGVCAGGSIRQFSELVPAGTTIYGFDCWEGLPEPWMVNEGKTDAYARHAKGDFASEKPTDLPDNIILIDGLFEDSIAPFKEKVKDKIAFIHIDCDLYSSTKTIFDQLKDRFQDGTIIVFDELIGYEGWEDHEYKAFHEFLDETGYFWECIGTTATTIVAMRIFKP
jgi:hypothetical protein